MTLAEQLRNEIRFTEKETTAIKKEILASIKGGGRCSFICDRHIREIELHGFCCMPLKYEDCLIRLVRNEGLNYTYKYNGYGVRYIVITL